MSDHTPASSHHKKIHVLGTSRKKKYLRILLLILLAAFVAIGYFAISSGILADENPEIPRHLISRINDERLARDLPPVQLSSTLSQDALVASQEIRVSPRAYVSGSKVSEKGTDVFIYPKISWAMAGIGLEPMLFDAWKTNDAGFAADVLDKEAREVGIGISSDGYNYYIVTKWQ
jgi:hypothetical protein